MTIVTKTYDIGGEGTTLKSNSKWGLNGLKIANFTFGLLMGERWFSYKKTKATEKKNNDIQAIKNEIKTLETAQAKTKKDELIVTLKKTYFSKEHPEGVNPHVSVTYTSLLQPLKTDLARTEQKPAVDNTDVGIVLGIGLLTGGITYIISRSSKRIVSFALNKGDALHALFKQNPSANEKEYKQQKNTYFP